MSEGLRLRDLAARLEARLEGEDRLLRGLAALDEAGPEQLGFLANPAYRERLAVTRAGAVILRAEDAGLRPAGCAALICEEPYLAFARAMQLFHPAQAEARRGIHPAAVVEPGAEVDPQAWIGPFVHLGAGCRVGRGTVVLAGCVLYEDVIVGEDCLLHGGCQLRPGTRVGDRVVLHNGVVLGAEGFGFAEDAAGAVKIPQAGRVVIEDDVEIGANACVDRATLGETVIARGAKLDNLVHIGHNVRVGAGTRMAAQVGVAGSASIGAGCLVGGASAINGHIQVGDGARIGGRSGVIGSVPAGAVYAGFPARPHQDFLRQSGALSGLPEALRELRRLRRRIFELEQGMAAGNEDAQ
jgi:UDP-3-O-[3-hydroxymyristoyl] glucosamine N-acyltransferase